jgi:hypothetical protein
MIAPTARGTPPFDRARRHGHEFAQHADLGGVVEAGIVHDGAAHESQCEVARVDREPEPLLHVHARHVAARQRGVLDVVVHERGRVEVLDGGGGRPRLLRVPAHRLARKQADQGAMALARVVRERAQGPVEVAHHVRMRAVFEEARQVAFEGLAVAAQVELETRHIVSRMRPCPGAVRTPDSTSACGAG